MKKYLFIAAVLLSSSSALAQSSPARTDQPPTTMPGHELTFDVGSYNYVEPGDLKISIHGVKFGGEYTGTFLASASRHWFVQANVAAKTGTTNYDGWCAPWIITPDRTSPNGYALDVGDFSTCDDSGNRDWYAEGRALTGKDFVGRHWTWSPASGIGVRHLSNALDGIAGFRVDNYLYLPLRLTARTAVASHNALTFDVEYDHLLHGWQTTKDSAFGVEDIDATATAPPFTINDVTDISFDQTKGWALRGSATFEMTRHLSIQPYWVHWSVQSSPVNYETATFTVNGIRASEQLGAYEPDNTTNEFGVKFGVRFP
jgi:hypothetical protein